MRRSLRAFAGSERGTVAIQTIIFSVLLFGTAGLVLDTGRVYATHSQMQAFADQMALAAAGELDGREDAIERATDAIFGFDDTPLLTKAGIGVGDFRVASVDYYAGMAPSSRLQNDMTEAFPAAARLARATDGTPQYLAGDAAEAAAAATVAVVSVTEEEVRSALARISTTIVDIATASGIGDGPIFASGLKIGAIAAASLERRSCAALSTLVLCNPWEDAAESPLLTPEGEPGPSIPGRSLMTFAPNFRAQGLAEAPQTTPNAASIFPWDVTNQLFRLASPVADAAGLCSPEHLATLAGEDAGSSDAPDYLAARDRCLMARAHPETVCWAPGTPMTIAPADGETVARALNTAFDNWLPPFDAAIAEPVVVGATGLTRAQFFEPDRLAATPYESADRHGPDPETQPQQDGIPDYDVEPNVDDFRDDYDTVPMPGFAALEPVHAPGVGYDPCHDGTYARYAVQGVAGAAGAVASPACSEDFVGDYYSGPGATEVRASLEHYWTSMYEDPGPLPGEVSTWYQLYRAEKERFATLRTDGANSRIVQFSDENVARFGLSAPDEPYVKQGPDEYARLSGNDVLLNAGYERRRLRSAMVNCAATVARDPDGSGRYEVHPADIRILDVYLPQPPGIFCGSGRGPDPGEIAGPGELGCAPEHAVETRLFVELVEDVTERSDHRRYVAQLIR